MSRSCQAIRDHEVIDGPECVFFEDNAHKSNFTAFVTFSHVVTYGHNSAVSLTPCSATTSNAPAVPRLSKPRYCPHGTADQLLFACLVRHPHKYPHSRHQCCPPRSCRSHTCSKGPSRRPAKPGCHTGGPTLDVSALSAPSLLFVDGRNVLFGVQTITDENQSPPCRQPWTNPPTGPPSTTHVTRTPTCTNGVRFLSIAPAPSRRTRSCTCSQCVGVADHPRSSRARP